MADDRSARRLPQPHDEKAAVKILQETLHYHQDEQAKGALHIFVILGASVSSVSLLYFVLLYNFAPHNFQQTVQS